MFYTSSPDTSYRFGDIIQGYALAETSFSNPTSYKNYDVKVQMPTHSVVLTPCCSIEKETLLLSPLISLLPSFYQNPYYVEDFTRLNSPIPVENTLPPKKWDRLPDERKQKLLIKKEAYTHLNLFVYEAHDLLKKYEVHLKGVENPYTNYYMIDFTNCFKIHSKTINRDKPAADGTKILQLSIKSRDVLRTKLTSYFSRIPEEDIV